MKLTIKSLLPAAFSLSAVLLSSGCSLNTADNSEFTCASNINGVCGSPMQVYKMTNDALSEATPVKPTKGGEVEIEQESLPPVPSVSSVLKEKKHLQPVTGAPVPLREPARVMRIWIAPWVESKTDALHWPSLTFVEVEARKWSMGLKDFRGLKTGIPLVRRTNPANLPPDGAAGSPVQSQEGAGVEGDSVNSDKSFYPSFN